MLLAVLCSVYTPRNKAANKFLTNYHKILYIDPNFSEEEIVTIKMAAEEWEEKTNHIVSFTVVKLPQRHVDFTNGILVHRVNEYDPDVFFLDRLKKGTVCGYHDNEEVIETIKIVAKRLTNKNYEEVVLHELGHALGLPHNHGVEGIGTLMYPTLEWGANHITNTDLKNFCVIYHCDASKLNGD